MLLQHLGGQIPGQRQVAGRVVGSPVQIAMCYEATWAASVCHSADPWYAAECCEAGAARPRISRCSSTHCGAAVPQAAGRRWLCTAWVTGCRFSSIVQLEFYQLATCIAHSCWGTQAAFELFAGVCAASHALPAAQPRPTHD